MTSQATDYRLQITENYKVSDSRQSDKCYLINQCHLFVCNVCLSTDGGGF